MSNHKFHSMHITAKRDFIAIKTNLDNVLTTYKQARETLERLNREALQRANAKI